MKKSFLPSNFFDLSNFPFKDIFDDLEYAWNVIPGVEIFIKSYFEKYNLKENYKGVKYVHIGEGTIIEEGAKITGPLITGSNCVIGHVSLIRENCVFGDNVYIGHASEIKNSVVLNAVRVAHLNYIGNSILGKEVNISGGTVLANYRLDKKHVYIRCNEDRIETGLKKFGAIIGDRGNIGVNAVLNPGTVLEKNCIVFPLMSVTGYHKENSIIKR